MLAYAIFSGDYIQVQMVEVDDDDEGNNGTSSQ